MSLTTPSDAVERFEDAWQAGLRPDLDDYLPADGPDRRPLLADLVHVDLERRLKAGEPARVEEYLARYPELGEAGVVLALLAAEHEQRRRREPGLRAEEYDRRFPEYRERLHPYLHADADGETLPGPVPSGADEAPALPAIPGYEVLGELGRGGMGIVYRARQVRLNRLVALKMILAGEQAAEADLARFRSEAEAVARLQHPNIVQVYEVGEHHGRPYLALEFCGGGSLEQKLAGTPLPPAEAARLLETLARAVDAAHRADVVHRDLKPANVLLTPNPKSEARNPKQIRNPNEGNPKQGRPEVSDLGHSDLGFVSDFELRISDFSPKITDFGLAKRLDVPGRTRTGTVLGTPSYMAPEQAEGRGRAVGPTADVYALGAILYECLTGRPPFKAATPLETILQVIADDPLPPARLNREVPRDLETICLHCLQKEPHKRYARAADLAADLTRFRAGEPIAARPAGPVEGAARWVRRKPALAALAAVSALAAAGLLLTVVLYNARLQAEYGRVARERDAAEHARQEAHAARDAAEKALRESEHRLTLNYFAYGRLCAVAARLATAADRAQADEPLREFRKLERWLSLLGDEAVRPALADYGAALGAWRSGPPPEQLRRRSLALARACRKPWTDLIDRECPELANQVRGLLYARAVEAADEVAAAPRREDAARASQEFWELYWGELVMVEDHAVERAMIRLGEALGQWHDGPAPAELGQRVGDLRRACRLPAPTGRRTRSAPLPPPGPYLRPDAGKFPLRRLSLTA
jgi:serine/threonine protein kinase